MRAFISIDLPENIKKEIKLIQKQLPPFNGKITENENLHLTLKFLGDISLQALKEIKEKLSKIRFPQLSLSLEEIGMFDYQGNPRIVWIKIAGTEALQHKIDVALSEFFPVEERFMSHLTIARVKYVQNKKEFEDKTKRIQVPKIEWKANSFSLNESSLTKKGPIYTTLESYKLKE